MADKKQDRTEYKGVLGGIRYELEQPGKKAGTTVADDVTESFVNTTLLIDKDGRNAWTMLPVFGGTMLTIAGTMFAAMAPGPDTILDADSIDPYFTASETQDGIEYLAMRYEGTSSVIIARDSDGDYRLYTGRTSSGDESSEWTYMSDPEQAMSLLKTVYADVFQNMSALNNSFLDATDFDVIEFKGVTGLYQEGDALRRTAEDTIPIEQSAEDYLELTSALETAMTEISQGQYGFEFGEADAMKIEVQEHDQLTSGDVFIGGVSLVGLFMVSMVGLGAGSAALTLNGARNRRRKSERQNTL